MRKKQLKTRISALFMAVSLSVVGSFAGVKTIPAAEEMSTTDISLYQEENQTQEKIEVQTETSPQLETSAAITESPQSESIQPESTQSESTQPESIQPEGTQPESTSLETESTIETASEHEETTVGEDVSETITETAIETTVEESPEESSGENIFAEESSEEVSSEEMTEEELTEEESTEEIEEETTEFEYGIDFLDLGDVTQIIQILSCRIEGSQVIVKGKLNHKFKTADEKLYLFEEPMYQKDITGSPIADVKKEDTFEFSVPLNNNTAQSKLYSKFFVGMKFRDGTYQALSDGCFITNPEALAENQSSYPRARSKKGLLTDTVFGTDIEELGLSYTNVNIIMNELINGSGYSYTYNGKTYQYSSNCIAKLDQTLLMYDRNNIIVNAILLWQPDQNPHSFGYPGANASIGAYHGWNVVSKEGIECISAAIHFLGERYGRSDHAYGHIASWTVGNEVNADTSWNYTGHQSAPDYAYIYTNMMRITSQAVKSSCAHARVFMSLDMYWHGVSGGTRYDGKELIDYVNTYMKAEGDIEWGVAFHPYGNPLTEAEWWNDNATFNENAIFISMENISVLTGYLCKNGLRNPDGSVKHVILSEQGYTSHSFNQGNVEWKQAAALAYAYYVTEANPYIDAFIAMREVDAKPEADAGIHQGLWYNDENKAWCTFAKKPAWTVWKYIDTNQSFAYTDSLASLVGLPSFSSVYGSVMASKNRSADLGTGGYAASCNVGTTLMNGWYGEYGLTSCSADSQKIAVNAGANSPFTYAGIARAGNVDFSSQHYFCFNISGTAGDNQNLRVRMRFTSGQDTLETELALKKNVNQMIYADLGNWKGKSNVSKIQIWVQQDGTEKWQNGSFTIQNVCQSSSISTTSAPSLTITESGYTGVTQDAFTAYCKVSGTKPVARVEYSAWNIAFSTEKTVTKQGSISGGYSQCSFSISEFGWRTGAYGVRIVAYDTDNVASKPVLVSVTVKGAAEALVIYNVYTTDISYNGFTLTVEAASDYGLSGNSSVAVWSSTAGQAKTLVWYPLQFVNGRASVRVNISNHGNYRGEYNCHAYVTDNRGTKKLYALTASVPTPVPKITSASVTEVSALGYQVNANFDCPLGVSKAEMKTWTDKLGLGAAVTTNMTVNGSSVMSYVMTSAHQNKSGTYHSVIYLYDKAGNCVTRTLDVQIPEDLERVSGKPKITASCTQTSADHYRISFQYSTFFGVNAIRVATWTAENGQDDLVWRDINYNPSTKSGYIDLPAKDKKGGPYINDVYIWDYAGQFSMYRVITNTPSKMPKIVKITVSEVSSTGYRVTAQIEASRGISKVLLPTWTEANGQDDLVWHQASVSQNTATCYIRTSDHKNEYGTYITHVYVYDADGDFALEGTDVIIDASSNSGYTGLLCQDGIWKYYQNGVFASYYMNMVYYNENWYYVKNGVIDWTYTGLYQYNGTWYYIQKGVLNWNYTGLCQYNGTWYYIQKGALKWNYTGLCQYNGTWYYIKNGALNWNYTGLCQYNKTWYYIQNGALNWNYTGLCQYYGTWYYIQNGTLNWKYTGLCFFQNKWYMIRSGVLDWKYTNLVKHQGSWYYVKNGMIDWSYTGVFLYYGRLYYIQKGWLNWGYNGECTSQGKTYMVTWGVAKEK